MRQEKEIVRQCFLFSNHLIITSRTTAGRLHLVDDIGKISLAEVSLTEEPCEESAAGDEDCSLYSSDLSYSSLSDLSNTSCNQTKQDYHGWVPCQIKKRDLLKTVKIIKNYIL